MQYNDTHLSFLREKIMETKVAIFKSEINSELSLPTNVIQTLSVDEEGNIYFFTACNGNYANNIDLPFYAYLDYHKRGFENRLRISGKAVIVRDENKDAEETVQLDGVTAKSIVMIKMKIMQAEFFEKRSLAHVSWAEKLKNVIELILPLSSFKVYNFSK